MVNAESKSRRNSLLDGIKEELSTSLSKSSSNENEYKSYTYPDAEDELDDLIPQTRTTGLFEGDSLISGLTDVWGTKNDVNVVTFNRNNNNGMNNRASESVKCKASKRKLVKIGDTNNNNSKNEQQKKKESVSVMYPPFLVTPVNVKAYEAGFSIQVTSRKIDTQIDNENGLIFEIETTVPYSVPLLELNSTSPISISKQKVSSKSTQQQQAHVNGNDGDNCFVVNVKRGVRDVKALSYLLSLPTDDNNITDIDIDIDVDVDVRDDEENDNASPARVLPLLPNNCELWNEGLVEDYLNLLVSSVTVVSSSSGSSVLSMLNTRVDIDDKNQNDYYYKSSTSDIPLSKYFTSFLFDQDFLNAKTTQTETPEITDNDEEYDNEIANSDVSYSVVAKDWLKRIFKTPDNNNKPRDLELFTSSLPDVRVFYRELFHIQHAFDHREHQQSTSTSTSKLLASLTSVKNESLLLTSLTLDLQDNFNQRCVGWRMLGIGLCGLDKKSSDLMKLLSSIINIGTNDDDDLKTSNNNDYNNDVGYEQTLYLLSLYSSLKSGLHVCVNEVKDEFISDKWNFDHADSLNSMLEYFKVDNAVNVDVMQYAYEEFKCSYTKRRLNLGKKIKGSMAVNDNLCTRGLKELAQKLNLPKKKTETKTNTSMKTKDVNVNVNEDYYFHPPSSTVEQSTIKTLATLLLNTSRQHKSKDNNNSNVVIKEAFRRNCTCSWRARFDYTWVDCSGSGNGGGMWELIVVCLNLDSDVARNIVDESRSHFEGVRNAIESAVKIGGQCVSVCDELCNDIESKKNEVYEWCSLINGLYVDEVDGGKKKKEQVINIDNVNKSQMKTITTLKSIKQNLQKTTTSNNNIAFLNSGINCLELSTRLRLSYDYVTSESTTIHEEEVRRKSIKVDIKALEKEFKSSSTAEIVLLKAKISRLKQTLQSNISDKSNKKIKSSMSMTSSMSTQKQKKLSQLKATTETQCEALRLIGCNRVRLWCDEESREGAARFWCEGMMVGKKG